MQAGGAIQWGAGLQSQGGPDNAAAEAAPNMELSGALARHEAAAGGVAARKWSEPADAASPSGSWVLFMYRRGEEGASPAKVRLDRRATTVGREPPCDVRLPNASVSKQHAVVLHRDTDVRGERRVRPYIMDLESTNGTSLNGERIGAARWVELRHRDVLRFGMSDREVVVIDSAEA